MLEDVMGGIIPPPEVIFSEEIDIFSDDGISRYNVTPFALNKFSFIDG